MNSLTINTRNFNFKIVHSWEFAILITVLYLWLASITAAIVLTPLFLKSGRNRIIRVHVLRTQIIKRDRPNCRHCYRERKYYITLHDYLFLYYVYYLRKFPKICKRRKYTREVQVYLELYYCCNCVINWVHNIVRVATYVG